MVEIRHKETNEQYSHITFDSILDLSCLKDTDGMMRKSLEYIYNKSKDIFHYQDPDPELGTRSCKHLLCSLDDIKKEIKDGWKLFSVEVDEEIIAATFVKLEGKVLHCKNTSVKTNYIDKNNIPQIINPCTINIKLNS